MAATQDKKSILQDLLDNLAWRKEGEQLYDAFIDALENIPSRDVKADVCLNTVKYVATQNASARAKDKLDQVELASLFEEECKRFSEDLLKMPGQFREWLASPAGIAEREGRAGATNRAPSIVDLLAFMLGPVCNCERCRSFREDVQRSEAPTEAPPPPTTH